MLIVRISGSVPRSVTDIVSSLVGESLMKSVWGMVKEGGDNKVITYSNGVVCALSFITIVYSVSLHPTDAGSKVSSILLSTTSKDDIVNIEFFSEIDSICSFTITFLVGILTYNINISIFLW